MPRPGKTYVTIEDDMNLNPKVRQRSLAARWAYIASICYSGRTLSDGVIPKADLGLVDATPAIAKELVAAGLWEALADKSGWRVHDYLEHNRSRQQVQEAKARNRDNGLRGLASRYGKSLAEPPQQVATENRPENLATRDSKRAISVISDHPTTEQPELELTESGAGNSPSKSLAKHRPVDDGYIRELQAEFPMVNVEAVYERARNRKVWEGYVDKRRGLRQWVKFAVDEAAKGGNSNGRTARTGGVQQHPDDEDPLAKRLRLDAERRERERQLGVS